MGNEQIIEAPGAQVLRPTQCVPRRHARRPGSRKGPWTRERQNPGSVRCGDALGDTPPPRMGPAPLPERPVARVRPDTVSLIRPSLTRRPFGARFGECAISRPERRRPHRLPDPCGSVPHPIARLSRCPGTAESVPLPDRTSCRRPPHEGTREPTARPSDGKCRMSPHRPCRRPTRYRPRSGTCP